MMLLGILCFLVTWSWISISPYTFSHPTPQHGKTLDNHIHLASQPKTSTTAPVPDIGISPDEWARMQEALYWDNPDRLVTSLSMSTSPIHTTFYIQGRRESYRLGDELHVTVMAKDDKNRSKQHGGDFFQAKLFSSNLKASVFGEVLDHRNGSYSVCFLLPWVGQAQVAVRLIHSSEAVQVLKRHRDTDVDRVFFNGYYEGPGLNGTTKTEIVNCNVKWGATDIRSMGTGNCCCEYQDPRNGETWHCQRPKTLPCNTLVSHSMGGYRNRLTAFEKELMAVELTNKHINGDSHQIQILPSNASIGVKDKCRPGMQTPIPAGFYLKDIWTSHVCATRRFTTNETVKCLTNKHIYIMGDSTSRQWFEYLEQAVPTLKRMNLHSSAQTGPLMAVDMKNNIDMHWRAHGTPLRCVKSPIADLHYISNEIDDLAGGPHMVIVFNLWAHFTTYPLDFYAHRVARIRQAVLALLRRAPKTTVIIKSANTGYKDVFGSDWYSMQLDQLLRDAFKGIGVFFLDVWQMTACHYNAETIHPKPVVIQNEINLLLSFICPN